jgi:predicted RNase H-like HicB family nuclease
MTRCYPAIVEAAAGAPGYRVSFPDLPDCAAVGPTVQEAARNAEAMLQARLDAADAHGAPLPEPAAVTRGQDTPVAVRLLVRAGAIPVSELQDFAAWWEQHPDAGVPGLHWTLLSARAELAHRLRGPAP